MFLPHRRWPLPVRLIALFALSFAGAGFACAAWADAADAHIPPPQDTPYPGTIGIHVDASDTHQGIFRVHETIPVTAGRVILLYPKWIPGAHSPSGPVDMLAGLKVP